MIPILLLTENEEQMSHFLRFYTKKFNIPAYLVYVYRSSGPSFGIDDTRIIKDIVYSKRFVNGLICISDFHTATQEAQHSMLKVFEEYSDSLSFIICTRSISGILSTIISRCTVQSSPNLVENKKTEKNQANYKEIQEISLKATRDVVLEAIQKKIINKRYELRNNPTNKNNHKILKQLLNSYRCITRYNTNQVYEYFSIGS